MLEEALEIEGIQYISNPRPDRRGGGAAITLLSGDLTLTRLDVILPKNLEVVWGLVRPKEPTTDFKGIILCSFYSVPYSKKKAQLVQQRRSSRWRATTPNPARPYGICQRLRSLHCSIYVLSYPILVSEEFERQ